MLFTNQENLIATLYLKLAIAYFWLIPLALCCIASADVQVTASLQA